MGPTSYLRLRRSRRAGLDGLRSGQLLRAPGSFPPHFGGVSLSRAFSRTATRLTTFNFRSSGEPVLGLAHERIGDVLLVMRRDYAALCCLQKSVEAILN